MSGVELIIVGVAVGLGAMLSGFLGFGFALVSVPLLLLVLPPATTVALVVALAIMTNLLVAIEARTSIAISLVAWLLPWGLLGLYLGTLILKHLDSATVRLLAGVAVVIISIVVTLLREVVLPQRRWHTAVAGLAGGTLATSTGLGGPPIVLLLSLWGVGKTRFRATLAAYFTITSIAALLLLAIQNVLPSDALLIVLGAAPIAAAGKIVGSTLVGRVSGQRFQRIVLLTTFAAGMNGLITAVDALASG